MLARQTDWCLYEGNRVKTEWTPAILDLCTFSVWNIALAELHKFQTQAVFRLYLAEFCSVFCVFYFIKYYRPFAVE
jgi:hypothetical protein